MMTIAKSSSPLLDLRRSSSSCPRASYSTRPRPTDLHYIALLSIAPFSGLLPPHRSTTMGSHQAPPPEGEGPLIPTPADQQPPADAASGDGWATFVGYLFLALNTTMETRRLERGAAFATAAIFAYPHLLLLLYFYCLTRFQGTPRGSPGRDRLKAPLWPLAALLGFEFAYQLTGAARLTPRAWEIAAAAVIGAVFTFVQRKGVTSNS